MVFVLEGKQKVHAQKIYLLLGALFITSLVVSNLIFQKFFSWQPFGDISLFGVPLFQVSVGILPYPITFLITDLISEIYGAKKANAIVGAGIFASVFSMGIIWLANEVPAMETSPVDNVVFWASFCPFSCGCFGFNVGLFGGTVHRYKSVSLLEKIDCRKAFVVAQ
jgi:hypothetical protein